MSDTRSPSAAPAAAPMTAPGASRAYGAFESHARSAALAAALALSFTAVAFAFSDVSPATATVFRAAYALPFLWWLARREDRLAGGRPWQARRWALLAGVFFAIDLVLFHQLRDLRPRPRVHDRSARLSG